MDPRTELCRVEQQLHDLELQILDLLSRQEQLQQRRGELQQQLLQQPGGAVEEAVCPYQDPAEASVLKPDELQLYDQEDFPWSPTLRSSLSSSFGLSSFRPLQLRTINLSLSGRDVFLVLPTGGGKSLCYQLPALLSTGFSLVVSPLLSLVEDQKNFLDSVKIKSAALSNNTTKEESRCVLSALPSVTSPIKILFVTPEKISRSKALMSSLGAANQAGLLNRLVVDEVHCCSQWGHDFRPDFKTLGILKRQFPTVPLLGLTATANQRILEDCSQILNTKQPITVRGSFNRPNLYYEVRIKSSDKEASINDLVTLIRTRYDQQSGIVYVFSQKDSEVVSSELRRRGLSARPYHANMAAEQKTHTHRRWSSGQTKVVVATVAFGMGIHKDDVRFVIHHSVSKSLENYYQESGRAGRDGQPADCILYFGFSDVFRISCMVVMENVGQKKLMEMLDYCQNLDKCRRSLLADHFDERCDPSDCQSMCDTCRHEQDLCEEDVSPWARDLLDLLEVSSSRGEKLTPLKLLDCWRKRRHKDVLLPQRQHAEELVLFLLLHRYLREDFSFTPYTTHFYVKAGAKASLLKDPEHILMMKMRGRELKVQPVSTSSAKKSVSRRGAGPKSKKIKKSRSEPGTEPGQSP